MSTSANSIPPAAGQAAHQITESEIVSFLTEASKQLSSDMGVCYVSVSFAVTKQTNGEYEVEAKAYIDGGGYTSATTLKEAMAKQITEGALSKAKALRMEAEQAIAFAERLEARAAAQLSKE